jgi:hypothetical protein
VEEKEVVKELCPTDSLLPSRDSQAHYYERVVGN